MNQQACYLSCFPANLRSTHFKACRFLRKILGHRQATSLLITRSERPASGIRLWGPKGKAYMVLPFPGCRRISHVRHGGTLSLLGFPHWLLRGSSEVVPPAGEVNHGQAERLKNEITFLPLRNSDVKVPSAKKSPSIEGR